MRIISFIEEEAVIEKILRHCGLWKEQAPRPPPEVEARLSLIIGSSNGPAPDNPDFFYACTEASRLLFINLTICCWNIYIFP
jgi:hypothetical protein